MSDEVATPTGQPDPKAIVGGAFSAAGQVEAWIAATAAACCNDQQLTNYRLEADVNLRLRYSAVAMS